MQNIDPAYFRSFTVFIVALLVLVVAVLAGDWMRRRLNRADETESKDLAMILPSAMTLLALLIGFSFSMAASRYDQRKALEEEEANAIGTEYVLADLVPQAAQIHALLRDYTAQRISYYDVTDLARQEQIAGTTSDLQTQLWAAISQAANATPTPVVALAVKSMNDVINSQGYTQAMFWNRLPADTWLLLLVVGSFSCFLFGYSEDRRGRWRLVMLPLIIAIPFALIADLDSPRHGLIKVVPQNLLALQATLK